MQLILREITKCAKKLKLIQSLYVSNMESHNKRQKVESTANLLDLPEHVIRVIFEYIKTRELYFSLKNVNKTFKKQITDYISPLGVFALTRGQNEPTRLIHILRRGARRFETVSSIGGCFPPAENLSRGIGLDQLQLYSFPQPETDPNMKCFMGIHSVTQQDPSIDLSACNVTITMASFYGFDLANNEWKTLNSNCIGYCYKVAEYCPIGHGGVIMFLHTYGQRPLAYLKTFSCDISLLPSRSPQLNSQPEQYCIVLPEEIGSIRDFSIMRSSENSIMIIGGYYRMQPSGLEYLEYNKTFWQGVLTKDNKNVEWSPIYVEKMAMRIKPIMFKLKDKIYILGAPPKSNSRPDYYFNNIKTPCCNGLPKGCTCCDMYHCKEELFYRKRYVLPYSLSWDNSVKIATDVNDQFAVFIFSTLARDRYDSSTCCASCVSSSTITEEKGSKKMLIFTEVEGFQEIDDYKMDLDKCPLDKCSSLIFVHN